MADSMSIYSKLKKILTRIPLVVPFYLLCKKAVYFVFYVKDLTTYYEKNPKRFPLRLSSLKPYLLDKTTTTSFEPHYTYHPAWAARVIKEVNPKKHIDISSILYFSTMLSAFIPVEFYDYRPAHVHLKNLTCHRGDLTNLPFISNTIESISCMHTIEHIGLGRYGDPIDPEGDTKAINELKRVVAPGGTLLFVVPLGQNKLEFNAHRIYSYDQVISYFNDMELKEFSLIPDAHQETGIILNATKEQADRQKWGCGCFWFIKK